MDSISQVFDISKHTMFNIDSQLIYGIINLGGSHYSTAVIFQTSYQVGVPIGWVATWFAVSFKPLAFIFAMVIIGMYY